MNFNQLIVAKIKLYPFATACFGVGLVSIITWQARSSQPSELSLYSNQVSQDHVVLNDNELNGKDLAKDLKKAAAQENRIKGNLLNPTDLISARTAIDQLAEQHGVTLIGQPVTEPTKPGRKSRPIITAFQPVQFKLSFSGTPPNVASFLKNLESGGRSYARIDEVSFVPDTTGPNRLVVNITFDVLGLKK